jgi:hypothetical protein
MSLQNLLGISLEQITPQKETVRRLIDGAARHIADAKVKAISPETRFSSAYTAIRMLAVASGRHSRLAEETQNDPVVNGRCEMGGMAAGPQTRASWPIDHVPARETRAQ